MSSALEQVKILTLADRELWNQVVAEFEISDITFTAAWAAVSDGYGIGQAEAFFYRNADGKVFYPFLKRPIWELEFAKSMEGFWDTVNPYCYGGYLVEAFDETRRDALLTEFRKSFRRFASMTGIVTEFVRFSPMLANHPPTELFDRLHLVGDTISMSLAGGPETFARGYRSRHRQTLRKAKELGVQVEECEFAEIWESFAGLYARAMRRLHQYGELNLGREYFRLLATLPEPKVRAFRALCGQTVAGAALFTNWGRSADYFLSAREPDIDDHGIGHCILDHAARQFSLEGFQELHLGGGKPGLQLFKRGFSRETQPYFVGNHIHLKDVYKSLCQLRDGWLSLHPAFVDFFPRYRIPGPT